MDASQVVTDVAQVSGPTFCEAFPMWGFPCVGRRRYAEWGLGTMPYVTSWSGLYALGIRSMPIYKFIGPMSIDSIRVGGMGYTPAPGQCIPV